MLSRRVVLTGLGAAAALLALPAAAPAQGGALVVNTTIDAPPSTPMIEACILGDGSCTLRAAIAAAATLPGPSTITFAPGLSGGTIALTQGSLTVTTPLTIQGPGATLLTIDGSAGVADGIIDDESPSLSVSGLTLANGSAADGLFDQEGGGAIQQTAGDLTVTGVAFTGNSSGPGNVGGAIYAAGDSTVVSGSVFTDNTSAGGIEDSEGGAIYLGSRTLTVDGSTFTGNRAATEGGAIEIEGAGTTINGSTFTNNAAGYDGGGAIDVESGSLRITSSNFTANTAPQGGIVVNFAGGDTETLTITGSHITSNTNSSAPGADGAMVVNVYGTLIVANTLIENNVGPSIGGIYAGDAQLTNVTVTGNTAAGACDVGCAGGVRLGDATIAGSVIEGNTGGPFSPNCSFYGTVTDGGGNTLAPDCQAAIAAPSP